MMEYPITSNKKVAQSNKTVQIAFTYISCRGNQKCSTFPIYNKK